MKTRCYYISNLNPYFNLATEEYLLKNSTDDIFMLWQGERSIVVGKHQNALAEINHAYVKEQGLKVARRLSGGGTVFHDPGNINFTFIRHVAQVETLNYALFLEDVKQVLKRLDLEVYNSERDDLMLHGFKISGNAQHVHKNRVIHHGTLLFDSDLSSLKRALQVDLSRFEHKAVQSNRSQVANIRPYLKEDMSRAAFFQFFYAEIAKQMPQAQSVQLSEEEQASIAQLQKEKYEQWDWIYGYSPKYIYTNHSPATGIGLQMEVQKGRIERLKWTGMEAQVGNRLCQVIKGCRHEYREVAEALMPLADVLAQNQWNVYQLLQVMF